MRKTWTGATAAGITSIQMTCEVSGMYDITQGESTDEEEHV